MTKPVWSAMLGLAALVGLASVVAAQEAAGGDEPAPTKASAPAAAKESAKAKSKSPSTSQESTAKDPASKAKTEKATFGGGCFWCLEAVFERAKGVKSVVSGYAGGNFPRPTYEMVCTGLTGHAEVVQITYDPDTISYDELMRIFWACHDPTTLNRQGPDEGTQYRSIILYSGDSQKKAAQKSFDQVTAAGVFSAPIVTQLVPLTAFYPAERYHQDYFRKHRNEEYCQMIIAPKLQMMKHKLDNLPPVQPASAASNASAPAR